MGVTQNLSCDLNERLLVTDTITEDGTARGTPVDISGWGLEAVIHKAPGDGVALKRYLSSLGDITIPVGTDGKLRFLISNADVVALGAGDFVYYIGRTDSSSQANLTRGKFTIRAV
jgi:hypothetical protein